MPRVHSLLVVAALVACANPEEPRPAEIVGVPVSASSLTLDGYELLEVPGLRPGIVISTDLNDQASVAGHGPQPAGGRGPFFWSATTGTIGIPLIAPYDAGAAFAVNASNVVVGWFWKQSFSGDRLPFRWTAATGSQALPLGGFQFPAAQGINDLGQIVGDGTSPTLHKDVPLLWDTDGSVRALPTLPNFQRMEAKFISNSGFVVGGADANNRRGWYWTASEGTREMALPPDKPGIGMQMWDMNNRGEVVGQYHLENGSSISFIWSQSTGFTFVETIEGRPIGAILGIDDNGVIAGQIVIDGSAHAFTYSATQGLRVLPRPAGATYADARDVTPDGVVLGRINFPQGSSTPGSFLYIWKPVTPNSTPVANAGGPYAADEGSAIRFDGSASSDADGDALTYSWVFDDGTTAAGVSVDHAYANDGTYTVTLTVSDIRGASNSTEVTVTVADVPPTPTVSAPAEAAPGEQVTISGRFSDPGADGPWTATIAFGDGESTSLQVSPGQDFSVAHAYAQPGNRTVRLTVSDAQNVSRSVERSILIRPVNRAPVASAGGPYASVEGQQIRFDGSGSSDPDGDALTYRWTFSDGAVLSGAVVDRLYSDDAAQTVTLTVTDAHGASSSANATVTVANAAPSITMPALATIVLGETLNVAGQFSDPGADSHTATVDYDDGTTASLPLSGTTFSAAHTYASPGTFSLVVTVRDDDGGEGTGTVTVTVQSPAEASLALEGVVAALSLPPAQLTSLSAKVNAATRQLERGSTTAAANQLEAFLNQLDALVRSGRLTSAEAQPASALARRILAQL